MLEKQKRGPFSPGVSVNGGAAEVPEVGRTGLHSAVQQWGLPSGDGSALVHSGWVSEDSQAESAGHPSTREAEAGGPGGGGVQELWAVMRWADR